MIYYKEEVTGTRVEVTKDDFDALSGKIEGGNGFRVKFVGLAEIDYDAKFAAPDNSQALKVQQATNYLKQTDFKESRGTLTGTQAALRAKARLLLEGSFVEPESDLFDV